MESPNIASRAPRRRALTAALFACTAFLAACDHTIPVATMSVTRSVFALAPLDGAGRPVGQAPGVVPSWAPPPPGGAPASPAPSADGGNASSGGGGRGGGAPGSPPPTTDPGAATAGGGASGALSPPPAPPQPPGCAPCEDAARTGQVLMAEAPFAPIAGATIAAGAVTVTSGVDGRFALPPPSASAEVVSLTAPGRATSVLAGWRGGDVTTHLRTDGGGDGTSSGTLGGELEYFPITGRVVDAAGAPVAGMQIAVGSGEGVHAAAAVTGADGRFETRIIGSPPEGASDATVFAFATDGDGTATRLGALTDLDLQPNADVGDVTVAAAAPAAALTRAVAWTFPGPSGWDLMAMGPGGASLTLGRFLEGETSAPFFAVPGLTYEVRAWARGRDGRTAASWTGAVAPGAAVAPVLPAPPVPAGTLARSAGTVWTWRPVPEVDGYRVEVDLVGGGTPWEAFSDLPRLTLPAGLPAGPAHVRIVAATEGGLRSVSSIRNLRLFGPPAMYAVWEGELP